MFDQLSDRLQSALSRFGNQRQLTEENMEEALREVRRALLEADASLRVIKAFISRIKDRAVGQAVLQSVDPGQQLVKIVHDELVALLGGENVALRTDGNPNIIMLFGLQGSGKTTTCAKLALKLRKDGLKPLLVAADVYRPAAIQQLMTLGKEIDIPVHAIEDSRDVLTIVGSGIEKAKREGLTTVIVDTAGRLQVDTDMMAELLLLERMLSPQEKLLVIDAMAGQEAVAVAETFNSQLDLTGIVVTKLDGDARGGAALSVVEATGRPIKLIGVSEKPSGLEVFHPERMATRILGMGDVVSLVERAQEAFDLEEAMRMEEKMRKDSFSLEDFMKIQKSLKMLGSLDQILGMLPIPGLTREMREMISHTGERQMKKLEAMMQSMTRDERRHPEVINESRRGRIARGCGLPEKEVKEFLLRFEQMRMMMKQLTQLTGGMRQEAMVPSHAAGLKMPRSIRKKKKSAEDAWSSDLKKSFPGGKMPPMPPMPPGFKPPGFF